MKHKIILSSVLVFVLFFISLIFVLSSNRKKDIYSYNNIPIGYGKLNWGMNTEEIIEILGKPTSIENDEYQDKLVYDTLLPSELGSCSKLTLYIGKTENEKQNQKTNTTKPGLGNIQMQIIDTKKEKIFEILSDLYGELTVQHTEIEQELKKTNADYFQECYYNEKWYADKLENDEYYRLEKIYQSSPGKRMLQKDSLLFYINVSGVVSENTYPCNIQLNAVLFSYLLMKYV